MADMNVTNPLSGQAARTCSWRWPTRSRRSCSTWSTADPARTPTFTPFAQGDYFLNASSTTPCANNDLVELRVPAEHGRRRTQTFAWNHGGIQPEIASTWIGWVGPGIEKKGSTDDGFWTDHTDVRPTMLALLGLKDDYVSDGRVVTEFIKDDALPEVARRAAGVEELGAGLQADQRVVRAVLGRHADRLDRRAREQHAGDDGTYTDDRERDPGSARERDALAATDPARALERRVQRPEDRRASRRRTGSSQRRAARPGRAHGWPSSSASEPAEREGARARSTTSSSSTRRTTASTTSTAAGRA